MDDVMETWTCPVCGRRRFNDGVAICEGVVGNQHEPADLVADRWHREGAMTFEHREGEDGRSSYPPQPTDRPSTKYRRRVFATEWEAMNR